MAVAATSPIARASETTAGGIESVAVVSVPDLIAAKVRSSDLQAFGRVARSIGLQSSQTLIVRLKTTPDPLTLWALHHELDVRGVPPCLRWPGNDETEQAAFITLLADLLWFTKRHPAHQPRFKGWRGLFTNLPASPGWHATAHRQYLFVLRRYGLSHWCAKGLGLDEAHRQDLKVMQTSAMRASRQQLRPASFEAIVASLLSHAQAHPDKAGKFSPGMVATRRAALWRVYVLSDFSPTRAAQYWMLLTGEKLSRQAVAKQIEIVEEVRRAERRNRVNA